MKPSRLLAVALVALSALAARAETPPPQNVLQLSSTGTVEVQQDLLTITLTTSRDGPDAAVVQNQLKAALEAALAEAKRAAQPGQLDVRTGNFALYPRYEKNGRINGWQGTAELILDGRDFPRITQAAGRITTMTVGSVGFGLSREQRAKVEGDAQAMAIERFKARASELARGFGFGAYTLREVAVNTNEPGNFPRFRTAAAPMTAEASAPLPVEAGKATVTVTVSGSVQLR